jgi:hypothetical protein
LSGVFLWPGAALGYSDNNLQRRAHLQSARHAARSFLLKGTRFTLAFDLRDPASLSTVARPGAKNPRWVCRARPLRRLRAINDKLRSGTLLRPRAMDIRKCRATLPSVSLCCHGLTGVCALCVLEALLRRRPCRNLATAVAAVLLPDDPSIETAGNGKGHRVPESPMILLKASTAGTDVFHSIGGT